MSENLQVEIIYFYPKENSVLHKTDKFELVNKEDPIPVLRRGLKFTICLRFNGRPYDGNIDDIRLIFNFGPAPNPFRHTKGIVKLNPKVSKIEENTLWSGNVLDQQGDTLTLEIFSPTNAPVGIWNVQIETHLKNSTSPSTIFDYQDYFYLLFNPWNCHDLVYMPDERLLDEYVLTDVGKIWVGPWQTAKGREWVFGQFDECILPAIMLMFQKSRLNPINLGDPIKVTRIISKLVNSNDDNGILIGNWSGQYEDGTPPSAWTGSAPILQEFLESQNSVPFGQCWVFSGVVTTICRALGIPSRVVSNLVSAHDANATLTIDTYYNAKNEELKRDPFNADNQDSVWNYHVWNDVWMARPDLPPGYGGWQAIDATPQETSLGFYQCGPASLEAIKQGQVGFNYDVGFLIATVNADYIIWKENPGKDFGFERIYCNTYHIGRFILTKKPFMYDPNGDQDREDITDEYKAKEGSKDERVLLYNAVRGSEFAKRFYSLPTAESEDVHFELQELEEIKIGEGFCLVVNIKNKSDQIRTIKSVLSTCSVFYNGVKASLIKKNEAEFKVNPKSEKILKMTVKANEYLDKLVEYCNMKLYAIASVNETNQTWADEDDFQVIKPNIDIKISKRIPLLKATQITLRLMNPLKKALTNCKFRISGPNVVRNEIIGYPNVNPGGVIKIAFDIVPKVVGEQKIVATFSASELLGITGTAKFEVIQNEE